MKHWRVRTPPLHTWKDRLVLLPLSAEYDTALLASSLQIPPPAAAPVPLPPWRTPTTRYIARQNLGERMLHVDTFATDQWHRLPELHQLQP